MGDFEFINIKKSMFIKIFFDVILLMIFIFYINIYNNINLSWGDKSKFLVQSLLFVMNLKTFL